MSIAVGDASTGIFGESGSGGLITDVDISGGDYGMRFGNQQWTFRSLSISHSRKAAIALPSARASSSTMVPTSVNDESTSSSVDAERGKTKATGTLVTR
eukprot:gene11504-biopygen26190